MTREQSSMVNDDSAKAFWRLLGRSLRTTLSSWKNQSGSSCKKIHIQDAIYGISLYRDIIGENETEDVDEISGINDKLRNLIAMFKLHDFVVLNTICDSPKKYFKNAKYFDKLLEVLHKSTKYTRSPIFVELNNNEFLFLGVQLLENKIPCEFHVLQSFVDGALKQNLSNLTENFRSRIPQESNKNSEISASIEYVYSISSYPNVVKSIVPFPFPSFSIPDPISEINFHVQYPEIQENIVNDHQTENGFTKKISLEEWFEIKLNSMEIMKPYIGEVMCNVLQICDSDESSITLNDEQIISSLTYTRSCHSVKFVPEETMNFMFNYLFPDEDPSNAYPYVKNDTQKAEEIQLFKNVKSCGVDELPWRLTKILSIILQNYGEYAAADFWFEFIKKLQDRWDKCKKLPGVQDVVNLKTCLLNQKLQFFNTIISEMKSSQLSEPEQLPKKHENLKILKTGEDMWIPQMQRLPVFPEDQYDAQVKAQEDLGTRHPEFETVLLTADLIRRDAEAFKDANQTAEFEDFIHWYSPIDCAVTFEVVDGEETDKILDVKLSHRMTIPDNLWCRVWDESKPVPAHKQKSNFDCIRNAEKFFLFFKKPQYLSEVFAILAPILIHMSYVEAVLSNNAITMMQNYSVSLKERIASLLKKIGTVTRNNFDIEQYQAIANKIMSLEEFGLQCESLQTKLFPGKTSFKENEEEMIDIALQKQKCFIGPEDSRIRERLFALIAEEETNNRETLIKKSFTLYNPSSIPDLPHCLKADVTSEEIHLAFRVINVDRAKGKGKQKTRLKKLLRY